MDLPFGVVSDLEWLDVEKTSWKHHAPFTCFHHINYGTTFSSIFFPKTVGCGTGKKSFSHGLHMNSGVPKHENPLERELREKKIT